ncbi:MAG: hypothetical protein IKH13_02035 [Clostridia bacterium]|nr:hypothetical protein [Clostridia bacterium]
MTVKSLAEKLNLETVCCPCPEKEVSGVYIGDLLSWVMGRAKAGDAWLTIMSNVNIVAVAALADTAAVILTEGVTVDENITATALAKGVNIFTSRNPAYETAVDISKLI